MRKAAPQLEILDSEIPQKLPVLLLKSTVTFPLSISNVQIAVASNLSLLRAFPRNDTLIAAGVLIDPSGPLEADNVGPVAMAGRIVSRLNMADGTIQTAIQGLKRVRVGRFAKGKPYLEAQVSPADDAGADSPRIPKLIGQAVVLFEQLVRTEPKFPPELLKVLRLNIEDGSRFADLIPTIVPFTYEEKRGLLEELDVSRRIERVIELLQKEVARSLVARDVEKKTEITIEKAQREAYLREQLAVIHRELGEEDPLAAEAAALEARIEEAKLPKEAEEEARNEIHRLRLYGPRSSETSVIRTYLDWVLALPWHETTTDRIDLKSVRRELDRNHYGLEDVKRRILEFLAVRKLRGGIGKGSVLCIVGPPGTGKTSLGASIARAIGRRYVRLSVGGVHDEAEIRGHRRTYVGAMPGRILQSLRRAGSKNPVMVIDEVDKMERGPQGNPAAALLEVLDPEQNHNFVDHFLGVPFDLSQALFVATANLEDYIPPPLLDRMEVIRLSGYTEPEKFWIAKRHIWPRVVEENGLKGRKARLTDEALRSAIRRYTSEAGVRELTRTLETVCRKIAFDFAAGKQGRFVVDEKRLAVLLGPPPYRDEEAERKPEVGIATGLAWTASGGDLLLIEALKMPGDGKITVTGYLGDVMRESVAAALSFVRSRADSLRIPENAFSIYDIHIHFPAGAIPKDGPSAGITVAVALASLFSGRPVLHSVAMTGEISLRGKVLPVGGVQEKVLAAYRAGLREVILPRANATDLDELPKEVRKKLCFRLVEDVSEVFSIALSKAPAWGKVPSRSPGGASSKRKAARERRRRA